MRIFKRRKRFEDEHELNYDPANIVSSVRQNFYEDPEFKDGFVSYMTQAREQGEAAALRESKENAEAYHHFDAKFSDGIHIARAQAYTELIDVLIGLTLGGEHPDPEITLNRIRGIVGGLAAEAYFEGKLKTHPTLTDTNAIGYTDPEVGLVVVWDRIRGNDKQLLDQLDASLEPIDPAPPS